MAEYSGVRIGEVRYATARVCRKHNHERAFFSLLVSGAYAEEFAGGNIASNQGQVTFHASDTVHRDRIDAVNTRVFIIELMDESPLRCGPQPALGAPETSWLARRLYHHFVQGTLDGDLLEGTLLEMQSPAAPQEELSRPSWLGKVIDLLHSEFRRPISLLEIAATIGVHPAYLSRRFRRNYAISVGEYLNRLRVNHAQRRLRDFEVSLSGIALDAGFADQSHFTRVFRDATGTTPGLFRKRLHKDFK
jgi:AraC family transcriptional regulator